jgi:hypothetical protein
LLQESLAQLKVSLSLGGFLLDGFLEIENCFRPFALGGKASAMMKVIRNMALNEYGAPLLGHHTREECTISLG